MQRSKTEGAAGGRHVNNERSTRHRALTPDEIRAATRNRFLLASGHLVQDLVLSFRSANEIKDSLLRHRELARRQRDQQWLENVAWEAGHT